VWNFVSHIKRDEHKLRVFENNVLRRIYGTMRKEATGDWRKLHNEDLHNLHSSATIIRVIKSRNGWVCFRIMNNECKILVGKLEGNRPHGKPRYRWENNIEIDLK
jgi:hypothetical protein